jgi:Predicted acetyltransferase
MRKHFITLQTEAQGNTDFLLKLYEESRPHLKWVNNIDPESLKSMIKMQFNNEQKQINNIYPDADLKIVMLDGEPAGKFNVYCNSEVFRIIDIALLTGYRGKGIGTSLITSLQEEARKTGKSVCLSVTWYNHGAYLLYEKCGFKVVENNGVCCEMLWQPEES